MTPAHPPSAWGNIYRHRFVMYFSFVPFSSMEIYIIFSKYTYLSYKFSRKGVVKIFIILTSGGGGRCRGWGGGFKCIDM